MTRWIRVLGLLTLMLTIALPAAAQNATPRYQQIVHFTIKPGTALQFEGMVKQYMEAAESQGADNRWWMFQQGNGGSPDHYHLVSSFNDWGSRDSWMNPRDMFVKAHGEDEFAKMNRLWSAVVTQTRITVSAYQPDLSLTGSGGGGMANHYLVTLTDVHPDKVQDYRHAISKIREAQGKANGHPPVFARRFVEGNRWRFNSVTGFNSGADRDAWPEFGEFMSIYSDEERDRIMETLRGSMASSTWYEVNLRRDLSYRGPAGATN